ncbi:MAG: hypothetical protein ACXVPL_02300 [Actinomycetota bacterium]
MAARRLVVLLVVLGALAVPAGALRAACAGKSCAETAAAPRVPFCPLPDWMKTDIAAGYREDRSPDVLGVPERSGLSNDPSAAPWPSVADGPNAADVPIVFAGAGVDPSAAVPAGTTLDAIAPTIAEAIDLRRPHPDVRSGVAVPGVANGERPTLIVEVALQGIGTADVTDHRSRWSFLLHLRRTGAGTLTGATGSLPLDPTAILTTIGTGGLPDQHGMTGTLIRNDDGRVVTAWGDGSPPSVIATLADDLDEGTANAARVGLIAPSIGDRGLIGGTWYRDAPKDDLAILRDPTADPLPAVRTILGRGYGADAVPDVLGVVLRGRAHDADARLRAVVDAATRAAGGRAMVVVTGTGSTAASSGGVASLLGQVEDAVPGDPDVVSGTVPGGVFLDQQVMADQHVSGEVVVDAMLGAKAPDGSALFRDAFQGFAVSFARYC